MGRGVVWCGGGLRWLLNRIFLRPGRIWLQSKVDRAQEGTMPGIPTCFLLWQKPPGRLNGGEFTPKWPNSPQKVEGRNFKMVRFRPLVARSKNLAKADLMSPPPELSIFPILKSPSYECGAISTSEGKVSLKFLPVLSTPFPLHTRNTRTKAEHS
jgi:hypothetical protein